MAKPPPFSDAAIHPDGMCHGRDLLAQRAAKRRRPLGSVQRRSRKNLIAPARSRHLLPLLAVATLLVATVAGAQIYFSNQASPVVPGVMPDQRTGFTFCRLAYTSTRREAGGQGWRTDYPAADRNLMIRLPEFTKATVTHFPDGSPQHAIVRATDPILFDCPLLYGSDIGTATFSEDEVVNLRQYLLKGGLLWVDDFWGSAAWRSWTEQIQRVLPEYSLELLRPDHPVFSTFYFVEKVPQIPSIQSWRDSGGATSERGQDSINPHMYGISDETGRLLVIATHNTDIADGWEREGEDYDFFHSFSPLGYAVGVNITIWSMTH
jgi:hypothetical protein